MESFIKFFDEFSPYIIGGLGIIIILLLILVIVLFKSISSLEKRYRKFMRGTNGKNIEDIILKQLDSIEAANNNSSNALEECNKINEKLKGCVQKVAIMRYKAFEDVGSDLSFSIAILDDNSDGIILTGIYGREDSTTYAKPIDKGISRYDLSEEEIHVLNEAINKK